MNIPKHYYVAELEDYLEEGETVVNVEEFLLKTPDTLMPPLKALQDLCSAPSEEEIGLHGPPVASIATEQNSHISKMRLFEVLYARDAMLMSLPILSFYPKLAEATLIRLAELQGTKTNEFKDGELYSAEEPGKIINEYRDVKTDPIAQFLMKTENRGFPNYRSIDTTVLFIITLFRLCEEQKTFNFLNKSYKNLEGVESTMRDALFAALGWMERQLDKNKEGVLTYYKNVPFESNDFWQDAWDSLFFEDGEIPGANVPIAPLSVQSLAYDACVLGAKLLEETGEEAWAESLKNRAIKLQQAVLELFWVEEKSGGYFGAGVVFEKDDRRRVMKVKKSLMGHLLNSEILVSTNPEIIKKRDLLVSVLFSDELLCSAGVRTLADDSVHFKPTSYQNGSSWPWESFYIALGLEKHNYIEQSKKLSDLATKVVETFKNYPELVPSGDELRLNTRVIDVWDLRYDRINRVEQPAQEIQGWTVAYYLAYLLKKKT